MSNKTVQVDVVAQVSGAVTGMRDLSLAVKQLQATLRESTGGFDSFGNSGSAGFRRTGEGAHEGAKGISSISDKLREYRSEEKMQSRSTAFFAQELASLLPVGNEVAGMFGRIAGAVAGGIGIGLAFEGVKIALETFTEASRKAEERLKAQKQLARETADAVGAAALSWEEFSAAQDKDKKTEAQQKLESARLDFLKKQAPALRELQEAEDDLALLRSKSASYSPVLMHGLSGKGGWLGDAEEKVEKARGALQKIQAEWSQTVSSFGGVGQQAQNQIAIRGDEEYLRRRAVLAAQYASEEVRIHAEAEQKKAQIDREVAQGKRSGEVAGDEKRLIDRNAAEEIARLRAQKELEHSAFMRQQETANATEIVRINAEAEGKLEELAMKYAQAQRAHDSARVSAIQQEMAAVIAAADEKIRIYNLEADAKLAADRDAAADADRQRADARQKALRERGYTKEAGGDVRAGAEITRLEEEYRQRINLEEGNLTEQLRLQQEFQQKKSLIIAQSKQEWIGLSNTMGQAVGQAFATMGANARDFGKAMAQMARQVIQTVMQMVMKSVMAKAADAAAGAAASQSSIPVIGPALAIGAMAAMFAAVSGLTANLSAAKGYDIPAGVNPVVQTHQREMILPEEHADTIRGLKGKSGGGNTFILQSWDSRDVRRWFQSPEGQEALGAGLATRSRNGGA